MIVLSLFCDKLLVGHLLRFQISDVGREFLVTTLDATTIDDGYGTTLDSPSKRWWTRIH